MKVGFNFQVGEYYRIEDKVVTPQDREWKKLNKYKNVISDKFPIEEQFTIICLQIHYQVHPEYLLVQKQKLPSGKFRISPIGSYLFLYKSYIDTESNKRFKITP